MRIWDISTENLSREHLLGEHRELYAIWSILINGKKGYSKHPETLRWSGKLKALYLRHEQQLIEMEKRGFDHKSPLDARYAIGKNIQEDYVDPIEDQIKILRKKGCKCNL